MDFLTAWWMFLLGGIVVTFVISQSVFFMIKASKEALILEVSRPTIIKTIVSSMIFSIAPSIAILLGLLILSKTLGIVIPWIRLSVLGAVTYELPATINVVEVTFKESIGQLISDPKIFVTVVWVLTLGVIPPMIIIPLFLKKIQGRIAKMSQRDKRWGELFMNAMFIGMISVFIGYVVAPRIDSVTEESYFSLLAVLTLLGSAVIMTLCGIIIKKFKQDWLKNYAIPFSMIGAMVLAIIFHAWGVK